MFDIMFLRRYLGMGIVKYHQSCEPHTSLLFFSSTTNVIVPTADHLLNQHQFSPETASKVASVVPNLKYPEKTDSVLSFLKESGLSKTQLELVVQNLPKVLCWDLESTIKPYIKIFQDFHFSPPDIAEIISANPKILKQGHGKSDHLKRTLLVLLKLFGSRFTVSFLRKCKRYLYYDLDRAFLPNLELLQSLGISSSQLMVVFSLFPAFMFIKHETLKETTKRVEEMGVVKESKMFIYALRTLCCMSTETWERKLDFFRSIGFLECDIVSVFKRVPSVFSVSERKIKKMAEVLTGSGLYNFSFIVDQPQILIYSIERTIKPRLQVLKVLKRNKLFNVKPHTVAYMISEKQFIDRFVLPFLDKCPELLEMVNESKHQLVVVEKPQPSQLITVSIGADHLINRHQFSPETASKVSSVVPHLKDSANTDSVLSFFEESGFSKTQLEHVVRNLPKVPCWKLESTIKPYIEIFQDFHFSPSDIAEIISDNPKILKDGSGKSDHLKRTLSVLHKLLGSGLTVSFLFKWRRYLYFDLDTAFLPNLEFLQSLGISSSQLMVVFSHFPAFMFIKHETLKETTKMVEEMGVVKESKMFIYALRTLCCMSTETWERKLDFFRSIGFLECDILSVFKRVPSVFGVSERKIKEMAEVLDGSGLYNVSFIVDQPQILIYSIERTIKPRLQVLKVLKRNKLFTVKPRTGAYMISEKQFIDRFVLPFLDKCPELLEMVNESKHQLVVVERPQPSQLSNVSNVAAPFTKM